MSLLIPIEAFDNFKEIKDFPITEIPKVVLSDLIQKVTELDEREEFEPWLRSILADGAQTPHGPAEIVDIFTHHVTANGQHGMAAFILLEILRTLPELSNIKTCFHLGRLRQTMVKLV
jgi:hypothetical protein